MSHTWTMIYYSAFKKEGNSPIYDNTNDPWGYYVKWNKPATEGQILHSFIYLIKRE